MSNPYVHTYDPPTPMQDHAYQIFEDILQYPEIGITLGTKDIPHLLEILEAVPLEEIDQYRRKM